MSLVETAIEKLKGRGAKRADEVNKRLATSPAPRRPDRVRAATASKLRPTRAAVPNLAVMERNAILLAISDQAALRSYKILRTRVLQRMTANNWRSLAVISPGMGEGKSTTAINLALALAQDVNTNVFLVDLDMQRPQTASYLGIDIDKGLGDYLCGAASIEEIVYDIGVERLAVIPNSRLVAQSSEKLGTELMVQLVKELEGDANRIIIYDLPPLLVSDDVLAFAPHLDALLLVISEGVTDRVTLEKAREILMEMNLLGVVLNRSAVARAAAYY